MLKLLVACSSSFASSRLSLAKDPAANVTTNAHASNQLDLLFMFGILHYVKCDKTKLEANDAQSHCAYANDMPHDELR